MGVLSGMRKPPSGLRPLCSLDNAFDDRAKVYILRFPSATRPFVASHRACARLKGHS